MNKNKKRGLPARIRRFFYISTGVLFAVGALYTFLKLDGATNSVAGRVALKSTGMMVSPLFSDLPVKFWAIIAFGWLYLFWKHKLIVGTISGILAGVVLAVVL